MTATRIGLQISSLKPYLQTESQVLSTFRKVSEMGYRMVQLQWIGEDVSSQWVGKCLKDAQLESLSVQDFYETIDARKAYFLDLCRETASGDLCFSGIPQDMMNEKGCLQFAGWLTDWAGLLKQKGITVSFHPRMQEYQLIGGKSAVDLVMEHTPEQLIRKYAGRMKYVHLKDFSTKPDGTQVLVPVGQGEIPWKPVIEACCQQQIPWVFVEQERWEKDAFQCMEEGLRYLQSLGLQS